MAGIADGDRGRTVGAVASGRSNDEIHSITSAADSHSKQVMSREKRYAISMAIRTICFVLAVIFSGPMRWVFLTGAVFLPYIAVVYANVPAKRTGQSLSPFAARRTALDPPAPPAIGKN